MADDHESLRAFLKGTGEYKPEGRFWQKLKPGKSKGGTVAAVSRGTQKGSSSRGVLRRGRRR